MQIKVVPVEQAKLTHIEREPGRRILRIREFNEYVKPLVEDPTVGVEYEDIDEEPSRFVLSLRNAFRRNGLDGVVVRKLRGVNLVRAYLAEKKPQMRRPAARQATLPLPARKSRASFVRTGTSHKRRAG